MPKLNLIFWFQINYFSFNKEVYLKNYFVYLKNTEGGNRFHFLPSSRSSNLFLVPVLNHLGNNIP